MRQFTLLAALALAATFTPNRADAQLLDSGLTLDLSLSPETSYVVASAVLLAGPGLTFLSADATAAALGGWFTRDSWRTAEMVYGVAIGMIGLVGTIISAAAQPRDPGLVWASNVANLVQSAWFILHAAMSWNTPPPDLAVGVTPLDGGGAVQVLGRF